MLTKLKFSKKKLTRILSKNYKQNRSRITGRCEELRQKNQSQDKMNHSISRRFDLN